LQQNFPSIPDFCRLTESVATSAVDKKQEFPIAFCAFSFIPAFQSDFFSFLYAQRHLRCTGGANDAFKSDGLHFLRNYSETLIILLDLLG